MSSLEATFDFTGTPKLPKAKAAAIAAAYLNENEQQRAQLYDKMHSISRACVCILAKTHPHISEHCSFIMMLSGCCAPCGNALSIANIPLPPTSSSSIVRTRDDMAEERDGVAKETHCVLQTSKENSSRIRDDTNQFCFS